MERVGIVSVGRVTTGREVEMLWAECLKLGIETPGTEIVGFGALTLGAEEVLATGTENLGAERLCSGILKVGTERLTLGIDSDNLGIDKLGSGCSEWLRCSEAEADILGFRMLLVGTEKLGTETLKLETETWGIDKLDSGCCE